MKNSIGTNTSYRRIVATWTATFVLATITFDAVGKGKPQKSAEVVVTFDANNSSEPMTPNGLFGDQSNLPLQHDIDGVHAIIGSDRHIIVDVNNSIRRLDVDLSGWLGALSTGIKVPEGLKPGMPNVECGRIDNFDLEPLANGNWSFTDARFEVLGEDMLKLAVGSTSPTTARLQFQDASGTGWLLVWGRYEYAGSTITLNPGSDDVMASRLHADVWDFTTTGEHHAALFRGNIAQLSGLVYYGQFPIPFSGTAMTLTSQSTPNPGIPAINVKLTPPEVAILEPAGDQSLSIGSTVTFSAQAFDHCLDISEDTEWTVTVDGDLVSTETGSSWVGAFADEGIYSVTATAVNRSGASNSDTVQITIGSSSGSVMSVDSISHVLRKGGRDLRIIVSIVDGSGAPVSDAAMTIEVDGPSGIITTSSTNTENDGTATFSLGNVESGNYTVTVIDVAHTEYNWDGVAQVYNFTK